MSNVVEQVKPEVEKVKDAAVEAGNKVQEALHGQGKPEVEQAKEAAAEAGNKVQEALHRVMLAAMGTVGLVQDEFEHFVNKAVERGEIAEKEARKTMHEATEKRKGAEKEVDKRFEDMLVKLNIPTKNDLTSLNDKIADLTKKVESLKN
jgi:polyhydroxyalkanoate synthesis regulator phasin